MLGRLGLSIRAFSLVLLMGTMSLGMPALCAAVQEGTPPTEAAAPSAEAPAAETAAASEAPAAEYSIPDEVEISYSIDSLFLFLSAVLVIFMQAGFALVEIGLNSAKNAVNILFKNAIDFCRSSTGTVTHEIAAGILPST